VTRAGSIAVAFALVAAAGGRAAAQAPTPTAGTPDAQGTVLRFAAGLDGNLAIGVVDRYLLNVRGDLLVTSKKYGLYLEPRYTYAEVNDNQTDGEWYLRGVGFVRPRNKVYGFVVGLAERSLRRRYDHRYTGGAGVGWNVVKSDTVELLFAQGVVFEATEFYTHDFEGHPDWDSRDHRVIRLATRASGRVRAGPRTSFFYDFYVKPAIPDVSDYRILGKVTLELAIAGGIAARALLDYTQETVRQVGTSRDELMLSVGLAIRKD
jgi:hypothetical protein